MSKWVLHEKDEMIPGWLKDNLSATCDYCGSPIENYYNDNFRCTNRRCSNPNCISFSAAKGDFMVKLLEIKGIGFATCLDIMRQTSDNNHLRILPIVKYSKPMSLDTYLRIHCFPGVDSAWESIVKLNDYYTVDELASYTGEHSDVIQDNLELLKSNLQYVTLKERERESVNPDEVKYLNIMITGTPIGFSSKEDFIEMVNQASKGKIVILHQKTKRQSGVDYLIREPGSATRGKLEAAIKGGIPVVTSEEFCEILYNMLSEI